MPLFELKNSSIYFEKICALKKEVNSRRRYRSESACRLSLNNIQLLPGTAPSIPSKKRVRVPIPAIKGVKDQVLTGAIVEHSPRYWNDSFVDLALVQMTSCNEFNAPLKFWDQPESWAPTLTQLKEALLSLLSKPNTWRSIALDQVFFYKNQKINHAVTQDFYDDFLISLAKNASINASLKELSISPFSLAQHRERLVCFLTQDTELESLHLQINQVNTGDWLALCQVLEKHPRLNTLNLGRSVLDLNAYSALTNLLDKNYRLKITLSESANTYLNKYFPVDYSILMERLSKSGVELFVENYLSQNKLLQMAFSALESIQKLKLSFRFDKIKKQTRLEEQFDFLLTNQGHCALTSSKKEAWLEKACVLPEIYQHHKEYMKEYAELVRLDLGEFLKEQGKTVGYLLLEKVLETANVKAMEVLLKANVNLFECPTVDNEDPFLPRLFRDEAHPALQKIVLQHMAEDSSLVNLALERFSAYSEICKIFRTFGTKLSQYANILVYKIDPPLFTAFARNILDLCRQALDIEPPSKKRKEEFGKVHLYVAEILQIVKDNPQGKSGYDSFTKAQKIVQEMIRYSSRFAARGISGGSFLHDGILEFAEDFYQKLEDSKGDIVDKLVENNTDIVDEAVIAQQRNDIAEKDTTINDLLETIKKQQADLDEKVEKEREQHRQENERLRQESEQHRQESEQHQRESEQHQREKAALQAEIERLRRLMPAQNSRQNQMSEETTPQDQERAGSGRCFSARR